MKSLQFVAGIAIVLLLFVACASAEIPNAESEPVLTKEVQPDRLGEDQPANAELVTIPFGEMWGHDIAGTKAIRKLEPENFIYRDTPEQIAKYENYTPEQIEQLVRNAEKSFTLPIERAMAK